MSVIPRMKFSSFKVSPLKAAVATACLSIAGTGVPVQYAIADSNAPAQSKKFTVNIGSGSLGQVLGNFAAQTGMALSFDASASAFQQSSQGLRGDYSLEQGFKKLLQGTGITWKQVGPGSLILQIQKNTDTSELDKVEVIGTLTRFGDAPPEVDGFKAEYQTTATKMAMSLKETPQAISVVTRDLLDARQVDGLDHALELTAGTLGGESNYAAAGGPFAGRGRYAQGYSVRGYALDYYHGVKTDGFAAGTVADIDLAAYERVEVIKGPSGFFGTGPIGGSINLSRKKPKSEFAANVSGQVGSYDSYRTEADITGSLTDDGNLRGRLVIVQGDEGSFVDGIATDTTVVAPSLELDINDKTRVLLQMLYQKEKFDTNNGQPAFIVGDQVKLFDLPRSYHFGASGDERSTSEIKDISLRIDHEISDRWLARLLLHRSETNLDVIQGNYGYLYEGDVTVNHGVDITKTERWAGELQLEGNFDAFGQEHRALFGLERNNRVHERFNGFSYTYDQFGNYIYVDLYKGNFGDYGQVLRRDIPFSNKNGEREETDNKAVYGQLILSLSDRTKLLVNARYDHSEFKGTDKVGNPLPEYNREDKELTLRLGLNQELNDNLSAYAAYGESFSPSFANGRNGPLEALRGEGYELGLKGDWLDKKLSASLAVYRQDLTNRPVLDPRNRGAEDYMIAAGLHRTDGIEFELAGSPMQGLNVALAATWMENEFLDENDDLFGFAINGSAKHQFSFYANYELQSGPLKGLATGLMFLKVGKRNILPYDDDTSTYSRAYIDGYERVDLDFSYKQVPNWDLSLVIRNLFDEHYVEHGSSRLAQYYYVGAPRSALFKATYNF